jgi:hypothetical protein
MKVNPKIYLVLDNCFAIKRWVRPIDWMAITRDMGFLYAQASTDNEIDPLFSTPDYMDEWFGEVKECQYSTGVKVVNFYTGYQTYRTVGLAHYNEGMLRHLKENWFYNIIDRISEMGGRGLGFSMFAIPEEIMQSAERYDALENRIIAALCDIGDYAYEHGKFQISFEQMYVPYQPPFTIGQSERYLQKCYAPKRHPFYVTIDVGHMIGQIKYLKPGKQDILESFSHDSPQIWLGSDLLYEEWRKFKTSGDHERGADAIVKGLEEFPHMFAAEEDTNEYAWLEKLAKYSPIIHMQQTDGIKASHASFTSENNKNGIITGEALFGAIKKSYDDESEILPPVEEIYLSFELFYANTEKKHSIFDQLRQTAEYWRKFVPKDGMTLDEVLSNIE